MMSDANLKDNLSNFPGPQIQLTIAPGLHLYKSKDQLLYLGVLQNKEVVKEKEEEKEEEGEED